MLALHLQRPNFAWTRPNRGHAMTNTASPEASAHLLPMHRDWDTAAALRPRLEPHLFYGTRTSARRWIFTHKKSADRSSRLRIK